MSGWLKNDHRPGDLKNALKCGAQTRLGEVCRGPAMANGRCRMHGGASTGPRSPEGWPDPNEQIGSMVCIPPRRRYNVGGSDKCYRKAVICSEFSPARKQTAHRSLRDAWGSSIVF